MRNPKYFDLVMAAFVAVLLISNVASSKIVKLGQVGDFELIFDAGTILFPLSYIFGDILTEVYGYARARRVIWTGFAANVLLAVVMWLVIGLPSAPDAFSQEQGAAFNRALGLNVYVVAGSLLAFWAGGFTNAFTLARLKVATAGRWLWSRTIGSTLTGQVVDTLLFASIAFALGGALAGTPMPSEVFWSLVISNYVFKVGVEVLFTPVTYALVGFLKRREGVDTYDRDTDFNPFAISTSEGSRAI
jgi:queuosine precursor transporter